jgi:hypothetical protein
VGVQFVTVEIEGNQQVADGESASIKGASERRQSNVIIPEGNPVPRQSDVVDLTKRGPHAISDLIQIGLAGDQIGIC